jgi:carbon-monoxide dehydrogenase small subunit
MTEGLTTTVSVTVNGKSRDATVPARYLLSDLLRKELGVTGVKRGCDTGKCGTCTVLCDGAPIKSCSVLAGQVDGDEILTVEGIQDDEIGRTLTDAFQRNHALQCGYCTGGILMSALALLRSNPNPDQEAIEAALQGNICRCTGYTRIVEAVQDAATRVSEREVVDVPE